VVGEKYKPENFKTHKVEFYKDGVALVAPAFRPFKPPPISRGKIQGWSKSSRRRMREFLLTHQMTVGFDVYAVTYTIPGPVLSSEDASRLFHNWQMSLNRAGGGGVWRIEVQQRGAVHWHMIVGLPSKSEPAASYWDLSEDDKGAFLAWSEQVGREAALSALRSGLWVNACRLSEMWLAALDTMGEVWQPSREHEGGRLLLSSRRHWKGARRHCVLVEVPPDILGAWKRYLQDHATKSKQEQIGVEIGRHWGVVGRKHFLQVLPSAVAELTLKQYSAFLRCYHRLCTPYIRCPGALFGKRRGSVSHRGRSGRTVYFSRPETVARLVDWASAL
jgi:hypothetical protein